MTYEIEIVERCMLAGLLILLITSFVLYKKKKLNEKTICGLILCAGCIMRIGYALYTPFYLRGHDIGGLSEDAYGKAGYILNLMIEKELPDSHRLQLYQQPFFFILGALASWGINTVFGQTDYFSLVDAAKSVSMLASCLTLFVVNKLCDEFELKGMPKYAALMYVAFMPVCYLMAGRVGEGALLLLFMSLAVLLTRYWERKPTLLTTVLLAFIYGFGVMTKTSMAVPAVYTAIIFGKKLFAKDTLHRGALIGKEVLFLVISLPLGLWFNVRNLLRFGQPIGYVLSMGSDSPYYTGSESLVTRFLGLDIVNLLSTPYDTPIRDVSLPTYLLKGELFGEFIYDIPVAIPILLLFLQLLMTGYLVYVDISILVKKKSPKEDRLLAVLFVGWYAFAVVSNLRYPFGCTMDYRYYVFLTVIKALLLGRRLAEPEKEKLVSIGIYKNRILMTTLLMFCVCSVLMFVLIKR